MKHVFIALIRAYQYLLSPWVGGSCRFWPTCSEYARDAIERHGALRGGGGVDPVPDRFRWRCWCGAEEARHHELRTLQ